MQQVPVIEAVSVKEYHQGDFIVREGDSCEFFYAVMAGEVQILQSDKQMRIVHEHDVFGLENYYRERPYSTSAKALKPCRIACYRCDQIDDMVVSKPGLVSKIIRSAFMQLEQTTAIAQESLQYSCEAIVSDFREYQAGEVIIHEGEQGSEIFRLYSTDAGLEVLNGGKRIALITEPGEYFGEMSSLLGEPRSATIRSIGKSVVEVLNVYEGDLENLIFSDPEIAHKLVVTLAQRLKQANKLAAV